MFVFKSNNDLVTNLSASAGVLKRLEEEDLDEGVRRRLKDSSETPGALWHIYLNKDMERVREFLHKVSSTVVNIKLMQRASRNAARPRLKIWLLPVQKYKANTIHI